MSSAERAPVVVGVPVYGQLELTRRGLLAIDRHTPAGIELIVIDDCGPQRLTEADLRAWLGAGRRWRLVSHQANQGFVGSVNHLFELSPAADVVVVNSDVEVMAGWFEALAAAVAGSDRVASASSLATEGSLLSVPELAGVPEDSPMLAEARAAVPVSAELPVAVAHCTWFCRAALSAVGDFDRKFDPGYGEEVDWSLRATRRGLIHLAALHSFVRHAGGASFGADTGLWTLARRHELRLLVRYPLQWLGIRRFARRRDTDLARARRRVREILGAA